MPFAVDPFLQAGGLSKVNMIARLVLAAAGFLAMLLSGFFLLLTFGFASMVDPRLTGWDRWSVILGKVFDFSSGAGWGTVICLVWFAVACCLFAGATVSLVKGWIRRRPPA